MIFFFTNAAIVCVGVLWALLRRARVWRDLAWAVLLLTVIECVCGACRFGAGDDSALALVHRWFGHVLVMIVWCATVLIITAGATVIRRRPFAAIGGGLLAIVIAALSLLESFVGYLPGRVGPGGPVDEESLKRFIALHCVLLPLAIIAAMTVAGFSLRAAMRQARS